MADQHSIHDSLTDTHLPAQHSTSASQLVEKAQPEQQVQEVQEEQPAQETVQPPQQPYEEIAQEPIAPAEEPQPHPSSNAPITAQEAADALIQAENGVQVWHQSDDDFDDGYGTDNSAASTSLASSARDYIFENGRRYHAYRAGYYNFPNDEREQDREDLKHAMYLKLFNKTLHFAPIPTEEAIDVIDLGTGTGIWAVDFADLYPSANVLGIDLSPIQTIWVPPNLKFMVDDAEATWLHPVNHFDLVHTRHTIQAFRNWPELYRRAFEHIKPGGWIESQEIDHFPRADDDSLPPTNPMVQYWDLVADGLAKLNLNFRNAPNLASMMRDAGFVNVTERIFYTPIGPWPKNRQLRETGLYWRAVLMEGLEAIAVGPLTRGLQWRKEEVEVFLADVRKAYVDRDTHSYMPFYVVYGQKPYEMEQ